MKKCLLILVAVFIATNINAQEEGVIIKGVKWATHNVDAPGTFVTNPEDAGMFYQWNKNIGWSSTNPMENSNGETTWNNIEAGGYTWLEERDPCPSGWRVPTIAELQSLNKAGTQQKTLNGVAGCLYGSGNNSLFIPAAGMRYYSDGKLSSVGSFVYCWSNAVSGSNARAVFLYYQYNIGSGGTDDFVSRAYGLSVRCVKDGVLGATYSVTVNTNNNEFGTASGGRTYEENTTAIVTATAHTGYKFVKWTKGNGEIASTNNPYSFTVTEDIELTANFEEGVGIEHLELTALKIYPNPTTGELKIESGLRIDNVVIYDIFGKIQNIENMKAEGVIDISHLSAGVYFVEISTEVGEVTKKVLKE